MAQDGVHSHLMLTITFLLFLVAEVAAYTAMVHSSPGFLATGSEEIAESTKLCVRVRAHDRHLVLLLMARAPGATVVQTGE